ncbi:MAG: response regulator [Methylococcales bacterium]|jgi:two-component system, chemotaxis family, chemotaxis protein CheY|nr:response regulator [Methylococcales bacterium]MBT7443267.1 response regulator [Methylococcales bacterium]
MSVSIEELQVILVEPSSMQAKIITGYLTDLGIQNIERQKSGQDALDSINRAPPDLVICTMYLPDMTGTTVVEELRSNDDFSDVAFMLVSSETSFRALDPIRQAGIVGILPKPFSKQELVRALNSTIDFISPTAIDFEDLDIENMEVLVVDDSLMARKHITRILTGLGFEIISHAADGKEAIALINETYFDLIVTDYNMPELDGAGLVEYIRTKSSQRSIPVLMVTSEENESRLAAVEQSGVSAICDKPFETDAVKTLIQNVLSEA